MFKILSCLILIMVLTGCGDMKIDAEWHYPAVEPTALDNALAEIENVS
ncbi:hypothetical protein KAR91_59885 [Candidatus Pacearchaeota archaeon]|nr:hypothetical protein [Candidatus Pacearchaeota archaeon]